MLFEGHTLCVLDEYNSGTFMVHFFSLFVLLVNVYYCVCNDSSSINSADPTVARNNKVWYSLHISVYYDMCWCLLSACMHHHNS